MNYFELFSFSPSFDVDTALLAHRYRDLQKAVHPDNFAHSTEQDKRLAVQRAAQINDGFQTLKNPVLRAEHLLALKGITLSHESTTVKDTSFLMQQMQWRESLEDITHSNAPDDLMSELNQSFTDYSQSITATLAVLLESEVQSDLERAADHVRKLKFMVKLQDELIKVEDALFDND